jgi:hypothetical protein
VFHLFRFLQMLLIGGIATAATLTVDSDRMAVVDGKRLFILGLYENPADDAVLDDVAKAGFNLIQAGEDSASLDRVHARALKAWINFGSRIDLSAEKEAREKALRELLTGSIAKHPALLCWEVPDEALWNCWYGPFQWRTGAERKQQNELISNVGEEPQRKELEVLRAKATELFEMGRYAESEAIADDLWTKLGTTSPNPGQNISTAAASSDLMRKGMLAGYQIVKDLDQQHIVWMNHAPRNQIAQLAAFGEAADAVGCDIYPIPQYTGGHSDLADRSMTSVGAYTRRMQESAPGKPVWMVLQGFGWPDIQKLTEEEKKDSPRPNRSQLRYMCFEAIVHGGRGILFWGTFAIEKDSQLWKDVLDVVRELSEIQEILSAREPSLDLTVNYEATFGSLDQRLVVMPKQIDGKLALILVNECTDPLTSHVSGLPGSLHNFSDKSTGENYPVTGGELTISMRGRSATVLISE